jgi:hypothetical protein
MEKTMGAMTTNQFSMADTMNQQYEKWGIQGMFDQIKTWSEEANAVRQNIATLQDQQNQALLSTEGQAVSLATIKGRQSIIARQYDSKIAAESARLAGYGAMIESTRGNLSMAQSFVSQFVEAATYDYQVKRDTLQQFYNYNKDMFSYLGGQYESAIKNMVDAADKEYQQQLADRRYVMELSLQFGTAGIDPINDTPEQATLKAQGPAAQEWNADMAATNRANQGTATGGANMAQLDYWATLLASGQAGLQNVPMAIRTAVVEYMGQTGQEYISPAFTGKSKEAITAFNTSKAQLDTIEQQMNQVITATSPAQTLAQVIMGQVGIFAPQTKVYNDTIAAFTSMLARAAGEKGVLTDTDIARIKKALPSLNDTVATAQQKMTILRTLYQNIEQGALNAYSSPLNQQSGTTTGQTSSGLKYEIIQ